MLPDPAIVVVDDSEEDVFLLQRLLTKADVKHTLVPILDGGEAVKHFGRVASGQGIRPLACFLDIKMPGHNGFVVLQAIRAAPELDAMPVIMLSSSDDRRDILRAAALGAQCYLVKHPPPATLRAVVDQAEKSFIERRATSAPMIKHVANLLPT